ncbi:MAG: tyrosine-protein phosphatase [Candidatus Binataceae bacterium]
MPTDDSSNPKPDERARVLVDFDLLRKLGARNFRDLGGHPTVAGRKVRSGHVYRSSHIAEVPKESPLHGVQLRTLVTLQSRVEVKVLGRPQQSVLASVRWEHIPMGDQWFTEKGYVAMSREPGKQHLELVTVFRKDWQRFFKLLAERDVYPLLFHCSAGRDRTGVGAAMLLELLGVSREGIIEDFLRSNLVFPKAPLNAAQLTPVFELIDETGGIEEFMHEVIGLARPEIESIREDLLQA